MQRETEWTFISRLQSIVEQQYDRPAIFEDGLATFTYGQLWKAAGNIAAALQNHGCGPESIVAIGMPKSALAIAAILGAWRCGAAWTPIDIHLPTAVQTQLLEDSQTVCVLIRSTDRFSCPNGLPSIAVDRLLDESDEETNLQLCRNDALAYLIYTSGTSGKSKGVEITHRGLVSMLDQQITATRMHVGSRSLFLLSLSFDAAISDIGTSLLAGGSLFIETQFSLKSRMVFTPKQILQAIEDRQITYVDIPPAVLSCLDARQCPQSLETLLIGGEVCPPEVVRAWSNKVRLVNVYGPTEATICSSLMVCDPNAWHRPLLGQPLKGVTYRIANDASEGELLIGGPCLARGYARNAELTNAKFIHIEGERYFRTGDHVRLEDDGEYLFLGRIDRQIKLRGHRIEPEGTETQLQSHPGVIRAGVIARESDAGGQPSLVAFVQLDPDFNWGTSWKLILRKHVQTNLPYWMVPQHLCRLPEMPMTPTGKIDYGVLRCTSPSPEWDSLDLTADGDNRDATQSLLLTLYRQVLRNAQVDLDDDFLESGGDSLRLMELMAVSQSHGCTLSPQLVLRAGTVRRICQTISTDGQRNIGNKLSTDELKKDIANLLAGVSNGKKQARVDVRETRQILLTGATGFLGGRILEQLLCNSKARVYCLLRGSSQAEVESRLRASCLQQKIEMSDAQWERVELITGDIAQPNMGLEEVEYERLASTIDLVAHCAAELSLAADYGSLRPTNVLGTWEIARFVHSQKSKRLCYASSLAVLVGTDIAPGKLLETDDLTGMHSIYGGYSQSKWAAEWLLLNCFSDRDRLQIIRLGLLVADSRNDRVAENDLLTQTVRGLNELGCVPTCDLSLRLDATPVDYAAAAMTHFMLQTEWKHPIYHLAHPQGIFACDLFQTMLELWPSLEQVQPEQFRRAGHEGLKEGGLRNSTKALACLALIRQISFSDRFDESKATDLFLATGFHFDMAHTNEALSDTAIRPPTIDNNFIRQLLQKMVHHEF